MEVEIKRMDLNQSIQYIYRQRTYKRN